jgi:hypothetical protein
MIRNSALAGDTPLPPPPPSPGQQPPSSGGWSTRKKLLVGLAVFLVIAVIAGLAGGGSSTDQAGADASVVPTTDPSPSAPTPTVELTRVPNVKGSSNRRADRLLDRAGLEVVVERKLSRAPAGTVLGQSIDPGDRVEVGDMISIVLAKPFPRVPAVLGQRLSSARRTLQDRGFAVRVDKRISDDPEGTVIGMTPDVGTEVRPGRVITLLIAKAAPRSSGGGNCHPSYHGACLDAYASDYDCAGGSGDGPKYTGYVQVVGYDEFGLDSDGDGVGCEG